MLGLTECHFSVAQKADAAGLLDGFQRDYRAGLRRTEGGCVERFALRNVANISRSERYFSLVEALIL